jgi:hypothetical protein
LRGDRCILSVKYVPAGSAKGLGSFLRYVQFRDQHQDVAHDRTLSGLTKYVAHRDRSAPGGRLFGPDGNCGDLDRRALLAQISRSMQNCVAGRHSRAAYRMVLSPERADGLDLKALTRAAMDQLGRDAGGTPPWIAAIHRNTKHPHVHIVMAARREIEPDHFKTVVINPTRLGHMKLAISGELSRQRGGVPARTPLRQLIADIENIGDPRPNRRVSRLGLVGGLAQILDGALHAVAAHQRRELRRWLVDEEQRLRTQAGRRRHERMTGLDR